MPKTKIALIQQKASTDKLANLQRGLAAAKSAAEQGAGIVCFAELAFEPFYPQNPGGDNVADLAEPIPGPITKAFCNLARELGVVIALNLFEVDGAKTYDSSPLIGTDGTILSLTRMIHITEYPHCHEQSYYVPGDKGIPVVETEFGKIGVCICYDRHFPEYLRGLALAGADIVIVPQAGSVGEWPEGLYEAEMQVAAFHNGFFTALCNRVGKESKLTFGGESFVCDPNGKVIARAGEGTEETLFAELDLDQVAQSDARRLFLQHRRPELYSDWLS
jgi:N-carbamoylputrescine amidase